MNYSKFLCLALLSLLICSCGKDGDEMNQMAIEGEWNLTALDYNSTATTRSTQFNVSATAETTGVGKDFDIQLNLKGDNTYTSQGSYTVELTTGLVGQTPTTQDYVISDFFGSGNWELNDDMIIFESDIDASSSKIISQTSNKMVISFEKSDTTRDQISIITKYINGQYTLEK